jgi:hypothetical protein
LETRIILHEKTICVPLFEIEPCSQTERWQDQDKWAVMKHGRKSAIRLLYGYTDAQNYIANEVKKDIDKHYIEKRPGLPKRCIDYCSVNKFCPWFQQYTINNISK